MKLCIVFVVFPMNKISNPDLRYWNGHDLLQREKFPKMNAYFFAEFQSQLSGTFKIESEPKLAIISEFFVNRKWLSWSIRIILTRYAVRANWSSGIVDHGLFWVCRTFGPYVSLFIYEIATPWTKSIREKEKIYLRFFYGLREDKFDRGNCFRSLADRTTVPVVGLSVYFLYFRSNPLNYSDPLLFAKVAYS